MEWRAFGENGLHALIAKIKELGTDLVGLAERMNAALNGKQDKLTPGPGIAINGSVISASGSSAVFSVGDTAPENTNLLWIDTGAGVTKYYTGSAWVALPVAWG